MNELLFFLHISFTLGATLLALRIGKEALLALFPLLAIMGNLFVTKQMICFGLNITCSDVYMIGAFLVLNLLQETGGKKLAKKAVMSTFFFLIFFAIMSQIHLLYRPSLYDTSQNSFQKILSTTPRIMLSSIICALLSQRLDIELLSLFKKKLAPNSLLLRISGSMLISQLVDTLLFSFLALYGEVHSLISIIFMSFLIKLLIIFTISPFTLLTQKWIKRHAD